VSLVKNSNDKKVVRQFPLGSRFGADSQLHQGRRGRLSSSERETADDDNLKTKESLKSQIERRFVIESALEGFWHPCRSETLD